MKTKDHKTQCPNKNRLLGLHFRHSTSNRALFCRELLLFARQFVRPFGFSRFVGRLVALRVETPPSWQLMCRLEAGATPQIRTPPSVDTLCQQMLQRVYGGFQAAYRYGGCSSAGRAPDCGSGRRGFESRHPPQAKHARADRRVTFGCPFKQTLATTRAELGTSSSAAWSIDPRRRAAKGHRRFPGIIDTEIRRKPSSE